MDNSTHSAEPIVADAAPKRITLDIACKACGGTGLYVGMGERDGAAVVCHTCQGTGKDTFSYEPFTSRKPAPASVASVHVARGYLLGDSPKCNGGMPADQWKPGATVPADEQLYCPYLYTHQGWCAKPEPTTYSDQMEAPLLGGQRISDCKHWADKGDCWRLFHAEAPADVKRVLS